MKEFVMRGQTASGLTHTINFSGHKGDYGFKLVEFSLWPSTNIGGINIEFVASLTAGKTAVDPKYPNFDDEGLLGVALFQANSSLVRPTDTFNVINDTFIVTQDLILSVVDTEPGDPTPVNWQCKFLPVKLSSSEAALTNYRQFSIFDD